MKKIALGMILIGLSLNGFAEELNITKIKNGFEESCLKNNGIFTVVDNKKLVCEFKTTIDLKKDNNVTETRELKGEMIISYNSLSEANKGLSVENNVIYEDGSKEAVNFTPNEWIEYFKAIKKWNEE